MTFELPSTVSRDATLGQVFDFLIGKYVEKTQARQEPSGATTNRFTGSNVRLGTEMPAARPISTDKSNSK